MKISKRLLAVLMSVVMVLTIVPLGLFAFADGETPEPRTETIYIDSIEKLQSIGDPETYPEKITDSEGTEVTVNYIYKITKDLDAKEENFEAWLKSEGASDDAWVTLCKRCPDYFTPVEKGDLYDETLGYAEYDSVDKLYLVATLPDDIKNGEPLPSGTQLYTIAPNTDFDINNLTEGERATLFENLDNNFSDYISFEPIKLLNNATIDGEYAEGEVAKISGLVIKDTTIGGIMYAGLVVNAVGGTIKNIELADTEINVVGNGSKVYAGSFIAYPLFSTLQNVKSSANIGVTNKLYVPKSDTDNTNTCQTIVGGLAGYGLVYIDGCEYTGSISFAYLDEPENVSFDGLSLKDIYEKTYINLGGISGFFASSIGEDTNSAENAKIKSHYLGVAVNAGVIQALDNDYTLLNSYNDDAKTYLTNNPEKEDVFGNAVDSEPEESTGYQLVKAVDDKSDLVYCAYIRTPICAHDGTLVPTTYTPATCAADGNIAYCQCSNCGKYFKGTTSAEEITESDIVISKDTVPHTVSADSKVDKKDPTCTETGIAYDYYKCSVCNEYFKDAEGTQEVKENDWVTKALGHSWDAGEVTKEPTYDEEGIKTLHCTRDGCTETKTEPIAKKTPPSVSPKSGSGYKATTTGGKNTIILPNPSSKSGTTVSTFTSNLQSGYTYVVKDASGKTVTSGPVGTNYTVEIKVDGKLYAKTTIIVRGDTDCNGKISSMDYVKVKNHIRKTTLITDAIIQVAADANNDGNIKATDYTRIKNIMRKG